MMFSHTILKRINQRNISYVSRGMHLIEEKAYINGEWVSAASKKTFEVFNPATGAVVATVPDCDTTDVETAIDAAHAAFPKWAEVASKERALILRRWYDLMVQHQDSLARLITAEAGKPLCEALGEVHYGNSFTEYYSEQARRIHGEVVPAPVPNRKLFIERHPIGVAGLITPWNFPHAMITRKTGAALAAGCTCVIKPAEDTPLTALALMRLAHDAGIPRGVLNVTPSSRASAPAVGRLLCTSEKVAGISFTGSTQVGKLLYQHCASGVKRIGLELGGNAPFIVYNSANIDNAVKGAIAAKFRNCGQTCVAANRFLIQNDVYDRFVHKLVDDVEKLKMGVGTEPNVVLGPLINQAQIEKVSGLVDDATAKGASVLTGGKRAPHLGALFYEPTVLENIQQNMMIYEEEVFGPVIVLVRFDTEEESLNIANSTMRGLSSYIFTEDLNQVFRVTKRIEAGMCGVNEGLISTAEAPFGGIKESGIGREGSHHGIEDFTYYKYICVGNLTTN